MYRVINNLAREYLLYGILQSYDIAGKCTWQMIAFAHLLLQNYSILTMYIQYSGSRMIRHFILTMYIQYSRSRMIRPVGCIVQENSVRYE